MVQAYKTYSHEKVPGERIIIMRFGADYDMQLDARESMAAGLALLNSLSSAIIYIVDLSDLPHISVNLLIEGAALAAMNPRSVYRHPIIREIVFVHGDMFDMIQLAAEGLDSEMYGYIRARAFATMEEALAYARVNA